MSTLEQQKTTEVKKISEHQKLTDAVIDKATEEVSGLGLLVELGVVKKETLQEFISDLFEKDGFGDLIEDTVTLTMLKNISANHPHIQTLLNDVESYRNGSEKEKEAIKKQYGLGKKEEIQKKENDQQTGADNEKPTTHQPHTIDTPTYHNIHTIDITTPIATAYKNNGMTYCSRTAREVAASFGLSVARGSSANESFDLPIIEKDQLITEQTLDHTKHNLKKMDHDALYKIRSAQGSDNVVMDIKLHSSTANGKKYGHRAIGVMIDGKGYLMDPYFPYNGKRRQSLIPLAEVDQGALSLSEINYYRIPEENMVAALDNDPTTHAV